MGQLRVLWRAAAELAAHQADAVHALGDGLGYQPRTGGQLGDYAPGQRDVRRKAAVFQLKAPFPQLAREPALVRGQGGIVRSPGPPDVAAVPPETPGAVDDKRERPPAGCGHGLCGGRDPGLVDLAQEGQGEMQVRVLREAAAAACQLPQALAGGEQGF